MEMLNVFFRMQDMKKKMNTLKSAKYACGKGLNDLYTS